MDVQRASEQDADAVAAVVAAVAPEGLLGAEPPVDLEARAAGLRALVGAGDRSAAWVLDDHGATVGYATAREQVPGVLGVGMAIVAAGRGQGGGRALLDAILDHGRTTGAHKVTLEVWPDNGRAIALYAAAGFVVEGVKDRHYRRQDGTLRSAVMMARRVDGL